MTLSRGLASHQEVDGDGVWGCNGSAVPIRLTDISRSAAGVHLPSEMWLTMSLCHRGR